MNYLALLNSNIFLDHFNTASKFIFQIGNNLALHRLCFSGEYWLINDVRRKIFLWGLKIQATLLQMCSYEFKQNGLSNLDNLEHIRIMLSEA